MATTSPAAASGAPAAVPEHASSPGTGPATAREAAAASPPGRTARPGGATRLRALDGLRLLAALMVAAYHYGGRNGDISRAWGASPAREFPSLSGAFAYGCLGVQIFFLISGFVICLSGWFPPGAAGDRSAPGRSAPGLPGPLGLRRLRAFAASRVSRLYPAYWVAVLLVTAVFALPWVAFKALAPSDVLANLTMLQYPLGVPRVLGVCWTLWAEMRFYALFALCVVLPGATRARVLLFCAGWTLAAALAQSSHDAFLTTVLMPQYAPFFIGGIGLYLLHRFGPRDPAAWGIVLASWLIGQHYAVTGLWHAPSAHAFSYRSAAVIIAVVTAGFALVAAVALGALRRANWPWLTVAGALTYPFYLVHEHLGWVVISALHRTAALPAYATLPLTVALMLALAWLLHRYVERPLTPRLRRALDPRR
ncbi:acyltransferase [Streptomyces sp. NRRL F-4489]|uniref:acyltransferase family protein n=1 Tax=Streptomyces sp. NRRL F-4489 TaxID=1609095 RepID=UPI00074A341F|nr:acyltransferase [Streptomyces sp. NRRL F-4489]KUL55179.1 acyltransferase [Streptomyces sp. NRRL F-4489]